MTRLYRRAVAAPASERRRCRLHDQAEVGEGGRVLCKDLLTQELAQRHFDDFTG
jgi:hypothetical protein